MLAALLPLFAGCVAAWRPGAAPPGRFDLVVPEGWEVTRNRSLFGNDYFSLVDRRVRATIHVELVRDDPAARRLPLDLLAETRVLSAGRSLGVETGRTHLDQILLDGREAWAVTGTRRTRFVRADFTTVVARVGRHVAFVTLQAPEGRLDTSLRPWAVVLDSLRFPRDPAPVDPPLFSEDPL